MKKILLVVFVMLLASCSGKPSNGEIESQIMQQITDEASNELYEVIDFEKINGFEQDDRTYVASVRYDIKFKKSLKEFSAAALKNVDENSLDGLSLNLFVAGLKHKFGDFEAGFVMTNNVDYTFIKTDNGWMLNQ